MSITLLWPHCKLPPPTCQEKFIVAVKFFSLSFFLVWTARFLPPGVKLCYQIKPHCNIAVVFGFGSAYCRATLVAQANSRLELCGVLIQRGSKPTLPDCETNLSCC